MNGLIEHLTADGVLYSPQIIEAFRAVDRKDFVPQGEEKYAYADEPLPIGHGQTISQPTTVAIMLELLAPRTGHRILDIGSGSGWTTALLAHIVGRAGAVYGVEVIPDLVAFGNDNLAKYEFPQALVMEAGNRLGYPKEAPYDRILVSAAASEVPQELIEQLKIGGVLVMPVGNDMRRIERVSKDKTEMEYVPGFAFVPLVGTSS